MDVHETLQRLSKKSHITLKDKGNTAIWDALAEMKNKGKKRVLIPDQGGWLTYPKYPPRMGFELKEIPTDRGMIEPASLRNLDRDDVLLYEDPAGYFAGQDVKAIYERCAQQGCHVILDVSGSLGDKSLPKEADMVVGSFGRWKVIDAGYGGFIGSDTYVGEENYDKKNLPVLKQKLSGAEERLSFLYGIASNVKRDLSHMRIVHPDRTGLNVVVKFDDEKERDEIIEYCNKHDLEYTICPRYIRVLDEAVSIEIKRKI